MTFPSHYSFTLTNRCNLRCHMCGQWSEEGYMHGNSNHHKKEISLEKWKSLVDEIAENDGKCIILRGGETFLYPGAMELLEYINSKGIFSSVDTNGTVLEKQAARLVAIGDIHLTISLDGPAEIHNAIRGMDDCYSKIRKSIEAIRLEEKKQGKSISLSFNFTIMGENFQVLSQMPEVTRKMGLSSLCKVPYYWIPSSAGEIYEKEMAELGCKAYSWKGFHHENSGIDPEIFQSELKKYTENIGDIFDVPYLPLTKGEYLTWFTDPQKPVLPVSCSNIERLIDIQPDGSANFCVDFPDYSFGNVKDSTIRQLWNSEAAEKFRLRRKKAPFAVCYRCGGQNMSVYEG